MKIEISFFSETMPQIYRKQCLFFVSAESRSTSLVHNRPVGIGLDLAEAES